MKLPVLDERIESRCAGTRATHAWWPCAAGCDDCCRSLARMPEISGVEWDRLWSALDGHSDRDALVARIRAATDDAPVTCPLLDAAGRCSVYDARPVVCRIHGFYTERDAGLHCARVTNAVAGRDDVVWGNGEGIADDLTKLGEKRSLKDWLERADDGHAAEIRSRRASDELHRHRVGRWQ